MNVTSATAATLRSILANLASKADRAENYAQVASWTLHGTYPDLGGMGQDASLVETIRDASHDVGEYFQIANILREALQSLGGYTEEARNDYAVVHDADSHTWGLLMKASEVYWQTEA